MHPNRAFAWQDREAMLAFLSEVAFCTICVDGPGVMHAPLAVAAPDRLRFHVARANRAAAALDGARAVVSCLGHDGYISPDWYGTPDQVPTWNYVAVEAEGPLRRLGEAELVELLDRLGEAHEARLAPKEPWTRAKLDPRRFAAMLEAIVGYELAVEDLRGTRKLGQNKSDCEREGAAAGLSPFHPEMARLMREVSSPAFAGEGDQVQPGGGVSDAATPIPLPQPSAGSPPPAACEEERR